MSIQIPPPRLLIPPSAPFSPEQQAWLNGFFAAVLSAEGAPAPLSEAQNAILAQAPAGAEPALALADNAAAPWHDPSMPIDERMQLSDRRPLAPRLMAAMAQQDCGQCGYNCADYANAIAQKKEERLTLCAPGGKETARMLKQLAIELDKAPAAPAIVKASSEPAPTAERGRSRDNPGRGDVPVAPAAQRRRFRQDDMARRVRSLRQRPRLCRRRQLRNCSPQSSSARRPGDRDDRRAIRDGGSTARPCATR